ncbi:hypothetical protein ACFLYU_03120 [Candidatus Dependentiae bacterium]
MQKNKKFILLVVLLLAFGCSYQSLSYAECSCCEEDCAANRGYKDPKLLGCVFDKHWDCDSFLIKYSPYRNLMAVLMIDKSNNGYKIEIFNTYSKQKIFDFEPMTMPMNDFVLGEDRIIVHFSDTYGTQIAYDVFTGEILWRT